MADEQSPGDLFRQRRQQKQQQSQQSQQSSRRGGGDRGGDRGGGGRRGGGGGSRHGNTRGGGGGGGGSRGPSGPIEQGRIARLCDNFGFIYCASRPADMFFHYSSFRQGHASDLSVGDEVEFRVEQDRRKGDGGEAAFDLRLLEPGTVIWEDLVEAAGVRTRGVVERPAYAGRGGGDRGGGGEREGTIRILLKDDVEGSKETNGDNNEHGDDAAGEKQKPQGALIRYSASDYQLKQVEGDDDNQDSNEYSKQDFRSSKTSPNDKLSRGDNVDFILVSDRRSQLKYARDIGMIQSERERWEEEREAALLECATEEQGVVVGLKHQYGFIRSNRRREEIYFHFSSIELPDHDDDDENNEEETEYTLHEGSCLSFMVVDEGNLPEKYRNRPGGRGGGGGGAPGAGKISARSVRFLPEGSVKFQHVLARGVTGRVVSRPIPPPPPPPGAGRGGRKADDASMMGGMPGKVHLEVPIECNDPEVLQLLGNDSNDSPKDALQIVDVDLPPGLSPGGTFAATRDGSRVAVWVHEMDKLLFDVVVDCVDGTIRVEPTTCLIPMSEVDGDVEGQDVEEEKTTSNEKEGENTKGKGRKKKNKKPKAAVRLIAPSLTGRAEGIVHLVKDNFGFIHLAERNADAYFRLYDVFPPETNADIVRFGRSDAGTYGPNQKEFTPPKITAGTEVSFDIFVQPGGVQQQPTYGGRNRPGNSRENVKAIRLAVLPPGTIVQSKTLASSVRGVVKKEDAKQPFAGTIELEDPVLRMSAEERHPLVAKLLEDIESDPRDDASAVFHHLESVQENKVVEAMVRARQGKLSLEYIPSAGGVVDDKNPGRLRIFKAPKADAFTTDDGVDAAEDTKDNTKDIGNGEESGFGDADVDEDENEAEGKDKSSHRQKKAKEITTVRYDKHSLPDDEICDPPRLDDVVTCDIVQSRRSGAISVTNVRIVERKSKIRSHGAGKGNVGVVADVNESRHFGFIDIVDEHATSGDLMFFHCSDLQAPSPAGEGETKDDALDDTDNASKSASKSPPAAKIKISKGDEVKFDIVIDAKTGKQIAKRVEVLPRGTLGLPEVNKQGRSEANLCRGIILMEPSHTSLGNTPSRKPVGLSKTAAAEGGRWANPEAKAGKGGDADASGLEQGRVLLLEDPAGLFAIREDSKTDADGGAETEGEEAKAKAPPRVISAVGTHVTYTNTSAGMTSASVDRTRAPRRGDLVTFVAGKKKGGVGVSSVSNIRVTKPVGATIIRGTLSDISREKKEAVFQASTAGKERYTMKFGEVVSCDPSILKVGEDVEGILHDGNIFGGK